MMKPWRVRAEADREIDDAAEWYENERPGLGVDFVRAVREALEQVSETPGLLVREPNSAPELNIKRRLLGRFPYAIVLVESEAELLVLAVAHLRRRPRYWSSRLKKPSP